jgi:DNA-binding NarL/FixJ family response regulator
VSYFDICSFRHTGVEGRLGRYMKGIRTVIVDDSIFSIAVIRNILEENGHEVVGQAGTLDEVKAIVQETKPALVTMDMTLPGTDGFECTRAIHEIDANIKVIVVSSMMDDEIVKKAKENKVSAYVQKPFDADDLITAITRVMATDELYRFLEDEYAVVFKEALADGLNRMTKTLLTYKNEYLCNDDFESKGLTIIVGIIGRFSGRMLIDLSMHSANNLATAMLKKAPESTDEMISVLGEFTNIISGNACSILNRKNKALGLRVAPPSILRGENVVISAPDFSTTTAIAEMGFGELMLNVGFKRSEEKWM